MKVSLSWNDLNTAFFRVIRVFRGSIQRPATEMSFNHESHERHEMSPKNTGNNQ